MEIRIVINKANKEEVLRLIDQLVELEERGIAIEFDGRKISETSEVSASAEANLLERTPAINHIKYVEPKIKESKFGAWGMFNSFVPGKAALRVLIKLVDSESGKTIKLSDLVDRCMTHFSRTGLYKYRGFPKKTSESARSRLTMHLIMPYSDIGLIRFYDDEKDPLTMVTREGLDFSNLVNPLLDGDEKVNCLSEEESHWLINHLKRVDDLGYKEFSVLRDLTQFLASREASFEDIVNWFKDNQAFVDWLRKGSRYRDDEKAFSQQLDNVSRTFASGKVALLRELGIVSRLRANYRVLRDLET